MKLWELGVGAWAILCWLMLPSQGSGAQKVAADKTGETRSRVGSG